MVEELSLHKLMQVFHIKSLLGEVSGSIGDENEGGYFLGCCAM
jgi:hypothetical protein